MLELIAVSEQKASIKTNYGAVKEYILNKKKEYESILVTEATLKQSKQDLAELASARVTIDTFRKKKKKEMSVDIVEMEAQCKELIDIIEETETPLKKEIEVYNDKVREKRRAQAERFIKEEAEQVGLLPKYTSQLTIKDFYLNLTGTQKEVKEDIRKDAAALKQIQDKEEVDKEVINRSIVFENESLLTKLNEVEFLSMLENGDNIDIILLKVKERASQFRENQRVAQERAAEEWKQKEDAFKAETVNIPSVISAGALSLAANQASHPTYPTNSTNPMPVQAPIQCVGNINYEFGEIWMVSLNIRGSRTELGTFNRFLKEKGICYQIVDQIKL